MSKDNKSKFVATILGDMPIIIGIIVMGVAWFASISVWAKLFVDMLVVGLFSYAWTTGMKRVQAQPMWKRAIIFISYMLPTLGILYLCYLIITNGVPSN